MNQLGIMTNIIRKETFIIILIYWVTGCKSFEKEFILPLPKAQTANQVTAVGFSAQWSEVRGASNYEVDVALDQEFTQIVANYQNRQVEATELVVNGLEANTVYFYRVRAKISNQISKNSNVIEVTTKALEMPIVFPATEVSATGFRIHWKKMPIVSFYYLDVAFDERFSNLVDNLSNVEIPPSDTSFLVSNVTVNKQYFYRIKIKQSNSFSEYSNVEMVSTSTLPQPVALAATNIQLTSFVANWQAMPEALSYRVDVATDALFTNKLAGYDDLSINTNSLVVPNLDANAAYFYRIRAVNAESTSNNSNVITVTTANLAPPVANAATLVQSGSFQANWGDVPNASAYLLDVALDAQFTRVLTGYNGVVVVGNTAQVQPVEASTTYYYRVRAQGLNATSDFSNVVQLTTNLLATPTADAATNQKAFSFTANWQAQANISLYLLDVATDANFTNFVQGYQALEVAGTSRDVTGLDFKTTYYYRLRAKRLTKESANSNTITVNACISATCRLEEIKLIDNTNDSRNSQRYTYDAQNRLATMVTAGRDLEFRVNYEANNAIKSVGVYQSSVLVYTCNYLYTNGVLESITLVNTNGTTREYWYFEYNAQKQRATWSIHPDATRATLTEKFTYTYNGNMLDVTDKNNTLFRRYEFDDKLSPLAIFDPDICFFIGTNRDLWRTNIGTGDPTAGRGFMPIHNIVSEEIPASTIPLVVFLFSFNSKDVATQQSGIFKAEYTFTGCGF
ncbi:hypothetical protein BKI52_24470 [marine bacterium AO1-C]|nr:hypothetical protein BKI52_24470 [marine bacterium AO1-C]